ncbi:hypothetical protein [Croceitalea rosinachiae]|uniref:Uncharacterized protein n=1 Tax=Croceitalea rosinachiae TaxID=3075596 RepID=A0ABU3A9S2_9FLAO|nr:hypothetical protein [Croceitalea sp. F388]MDT0606941.1 hypothetical protein [Croceitalea sp. F388]
MKTILTLITVIFFGTVAIAQDANIQVQVVTTAETVITSSEVKIEKETKTENDVARLYMFKNSRIKKALAFRTKRNKSKLA